MGWERVEWGQSFGGLDSLNLLNRSCSLSTGFPVCCKIFSAHHRLKSPHHAIDFVGCVYTRSYLPSLYENKQFELARYFDNIADDQLRRNTLIDYLVSIENINDSLIWTDKVADRMKHPLKYANSVISDLDITYLSRFNITRECPNSPIVTWTEWIEPISVHARHPFSLYDRDTCIDRIAKKEVLKHPRYAEAIHIISFMSTDHILLYNDRVGKAAHREKNLGRNYYLFDAGASTFQSSAWWFTCMYMQHNISFDRIFGWELTLLKPGSFWEEVPPSLRSRYHFYNAPVMANISHGNSPLRIMQEIAQKSDFVAFKLDIDKPETEIPIAMEILENVDVRNLVDEFFFELHFRCEIMMTCAWGTKMPPTYLGLNLSRSHAMDFFQRFRLHGIRSHFWP